MSKNSVETFDINPTLRVRIEYDNDSGGPGEWDNVGQIAYCSSRETLGTERVSRERLDEISAGIRDGSLIGLPVFAYVHSGATIRCAPFSCPWDSGQSGFVYCTKEKAIAEFGNKILTAKARAQALKCLAGEVETFDQYLTGQVYGFIVERVIRDEDGDEVDTEELDSCWGHYGLDYCIEQGKYAAEQMRKLDEKEAAERLACEERDIVTEGA